MTVLRCDSAAVGSGLKYDRAVLFDRDGVINIDFGYVYEQDKFEWVEGAVELLHSLNGEGYGIAVITNQSGIGRGYYLENQFLDLMNWVNEQVPIDVTIYCPHAPEAQCPGRKPGTRMVDLALSYLGVLPKDAIMIGDKNTDIEAADRAHVKGYYFDGGNLGEFVTSRL